MRGQRTSVQIGTNSELFVFLQPPFRYKCLAPFTTRRSAPCPRRLPFLPGHGPALWRRGLLRRGRAGGSRQGSTSSTYSHGSHRFACPIRDRESGREGSAFSSFMEAGLSGPFGPFGPFILGRWRALRSCCSIARRSIRSQSTGLAADLMAWLRREQLQHHWPAARIGPETFIAMSGPLAVPANSKSL